MGPPSKGIAVVWFSSDSGAALLPTAAAFRLLFPLRHGCIVRQENQTLYTELEAPNLFARGVNCLPLSENRVGRNISGVHGFGA